MHTESAARALSILRDGGQFQWYVIPLLAFVVYVYAVEVERRNWNLVFAGLAFWGMDWINEIWNSLVFHLSGIAASNPGPPPRLGRDERLSVETQRRLGSTLRAIAVLRSEGGARRRMASEVRPLARASSNRPRWIRVSRMAEVSK